MLADGGDCVTDIDAYRGQERLFGARASETTTHRVLKSVDEPLLARVRAARARARARVWDAGARPGTITLNIDATLLTAHSEKERAAGNYKHGYGFHPIGCWLDETGEALAAILRPGNAGLEHGRGSLHRARPRARADPCRGPGAGDPGPDRYRRVHARVHRRLPRGWDPLLGRLRTDRDGPPGDPRLPEAQWVQAIDADGAERDGAWVAS